MPSPQMTIRVLILLVLLSTPVLAQRRTEPLVVGLLREDGIVVPMAAHGQEGWEAISADGSLGDFESYLDDWHLVISNTEQRRLASGPTVQLFGGDTFYESWGILTDYCPRTVTRMYPAPRVGAVLNRPVPAFPFQPLSEAPEPRIRALLEREFSAREREVLADIAANAADPAARRYPPVERERGRVPLEYRAIYRSEAPYPGVHLYYFQAVKIYPAIRVENVAYHPESLLQGWLLQRGDSLDLLNPEFSLTDEFDTAMTTATPFLVLPMDGATYIVAELGGWEWTERTIFVLEGEHLRRVLSP